jgi:hypothetical protein
MRKLIGLAVFGPLACFAQEIPEGDVLLKVKPVLCVTDNRNPSCELSFLVTWQSGETGYYCLFNDFADGALHCWSEERAGELADDRTVDESFRFWMTGEDLANRLAEVDVEVLRLSSDDRRRRRRTRHVWDLN